jgi:hypothetical protein
LFFWDDFVGSLKGGSYYNRLLTRPFSHGWLYLAILIAIGSILITIPRVITFNEYYNQTAQFLSENFDSLQFTNGAIANMPAQHIESEFDRWIIRMDTSYTDSSVIKPLAADTSLKKMIAFVGPKAVFLAAGGSPSMFKYPASFNQAIAGASMLKSKIYLVPIFCLLVFAIIFILNLISSLIYAVLIGLIVIFKFRNIGLSYKYGFQLGLYLVTLQFVISLILDFIGINLPYAVLWYLIMYILYVGLMVNLSLNQPAAPVIQSGGPDSN